MHAIAIACTITKKETATTVLIIELINNQCKRETSGRAVNQINIQ
jgi:hypothetical protein